MIFKFVATRIVIDIDSKKRKKARVSYEYTTTSLDGKVTSEVTEDGYEVKDTLEKQRFELDSEGNEIEGTRETITIKDLDATLWDANCGDAFEAGIIGEIKTRHSI